MRSAAKPPPICIATVGIAHPFMGQGEPPDARTYFLGLFVILQHAVKGLIKGNGYVEGIKEFLIKGPYEILAGGLVVFAAFLPFFALRELARIWGGEGKLLALLFKNREGHSP